MLFVGRWQLRRAVELIRGHCDLRGFQNKIGKASSPYCPRCGEDCEETPIHVICECPALSDSRKKCFGRAVAIPEEIWKHSIKGSLNTARQLGSPNAPR